MLSANLTTLRLLYLATCLQVTDTADYHTFVSTAIVVDKKQIIVCYKGRFSQIPHQYFAISRLEFVSDEDVKKFEEVIQNCGNDPLSPLSLRSHEQRRLHDLLFDDSEEGRESEKFDFFLPSTGVFMSADMKVIDVPRFDHFDPRDDEYPEQATYFMYGDINNAFLFHIPTKKPDYLQVSALEVNQVKRSTKYFNTSGTYHRSCIVYKAFNTNYQKKHIKKLHLDAIT